MKNMKERKLAKSVLEERLGFSPKLEDIIPLESSSCKHVCEYVMFTIKYHEDIVYRASIGRALTIESNCSNQEINM